MGKDHNGNKKASQIVMTLILNSQQKLGHEKRCGLGECPNIQTHSHKSTSVRECKEVSPKHSQVKSLWELYSCES